MTVAIKNLRLQVILGVNEAERTTVRDVVVNLHADYDARDAASTDRIEDALDYRELRNRIIGVTRDTKYHLLESLAECISAELRRDTRVTKLRLEVDKPGALRLAESVSVSLGWER
jgi:FolB domain-containing protein